jgi:hypothetical protein
MSYNFVWSEAGTYQSGTIFGATLPTRFLTSSNIRLSWKGLPRTNTLAYSGNSLEVRLTSYGIGPSTVVSFRSFIPLEVRPGRHPGRPELTPEPETWPDLSFSFLTRTLFLFPKICDTDPLLNETLFLSGLLRVFLLLSFSTFFSVIPTDSCHHFSKTGSHSQNFLANFVECVCYYGSGLKVLGEFFTLRHHNCDFDCKTFCC